LPEQVFHSNVPITQGNQIYLERPQIDRLLEQAVQGRVVTVTAGTGYGKTHSVYSFVRKCNVVTTWMQLSERDNISERFWENFVTAVRVISKETAHQLAKIGFPESERQFERCIEFLWETGPTAKYIYVYDDLHLICEPAVLRFMQQTFTTMFPNIVFILISRSNPSVNLIKLVSKGLLASMTEEELRFSHEEMVEYFRIQNLNPSPRTAAAIYKDTEGWAFAIHLAGLSLKNARSGTEYVHHALRSNIFKLVESEILRTASPGLRKFLIKLSLIDHLAPDLLQKIAEDPGSGKEPDSDHGNALIAGMAAIGSFIRFDTYINAYRIHHLLLEYLSGRQDELTEEEKRAVYAMAAKWCAENGQKRDAISYYEKTGDYTGLIGVIYTAVPLIIPNAIAKTLLDILERAPREVFDQNALVNIVYNRCLVAMERFEEAEARIREDIFRFRTLPSSPFGFRALAGLYNLLGFIGLVTSTHTRNYDYPSYFEKGRCYTALSGHEAKPPVSVMSLSAYVCRVHSPERGEMEKYIAALTAMVPFVADSLGGCCWGMDVLARAELAFFREDIVTAESLAREALERACQRDQYEIGNRALFFLLRISLARGEYGAIVDILKQLESQLELIYYIDRFTFFDIVIGWFYTQTGQGEKTASWIKNDFEVSDLNSMVQGLESLVRARYHFTEKCYSAALASLDTREEGYGMGAYVMGRLEMKTLEAVCLYQLKEKEEAYRALAEAYELAFPNTFTMPFIELGKDMRALTEAALKDNVTAVPRDWLEQIRLKASAYAKKLFAVTEKCRPAGVRCGGCQVSLSPRELNILTGLSQGLTRAELAKASEISVNTVKSVIRSVYNKLVAINRADAVRIATSLGLLGGNGKNDGFNKKSVS
jgi:LuxR family maltose regulon positive regulatory protein